MRNPREIWKNVAWKRRVGGIATGVRRVDMYLCLVLSLLSCFSSLICRRVKNGTTALCTIFNTSERWIKNEVGKCCYFVLRSGRCCLF